MLRTSLPKSLQVNGKTLVPVIGTDYKKALTIAKSKKMTYRTVKVLARNLKGRTDLHNRLYQPTVWLFVESENFIYVTFE